MARTVDPRAYDAGMRRLTRWDAKERAQNRGADATEAEAFATWFVRRYLDPRFRPSWDDAFAEFRASP